MSEIKSIPQLVNEFFTSTEREKAMKLLQFHKVNISFHKGDTSRFLTISGIIKDDKTYQASVSYKKKQPDQLTSHCPCAYQKNQDHCYHVAALLLSVAKPEANNDSDTHNSVSLNMQGQGVYPRQFGTIIETPQDLEGPSINAKTFNQLQYVLTGQKLIQFPVLKKITDEKIIIYIKESSKEHYYNLGVSLEKNQQRNNHVSLLSYLYLFDWKNGDAYELSTHHKFLFRTLQKSHTLNPIDTYLLKLLPLLKERNYLFEFNDKPINWDYFAETYLKMNIDVHSKAELKINLYFTDRQNNTISLPPFLKIFSFENGYLGEMKTKKYAYDFIQKLLVTNEKNKNSLIKQLPSQLKDFLFMAIDNFIADTPIPHYSEDQKNFYQFNLEAFKQVFIMLSHYLASDFIRQSQFNNENKLLSFIVSKNKIMEVITALSDNLKKLNIPLLFNDKKITSWKPSVQFKRNFSNINWLDISYEISSEDFQALNNFQKDSSSFINDQGELVLLDPQGKQVAKLLHFLNKEGETKPSNDKSKEKYQLKFSRSRIFELFEIYKLKLGDLLTDEEKEICQKLENLDEVPPYDLSPKYQELARNYQQQGYNWLRFLYENKLGACLADEMGLGKTLQTLMFIKELYPSLDHILIIAPVSIISNWLSELHKFTGLDANIYYGEGRTLTPLEEKKSKITITSYGILKKEYDQGLGDIQWDLLIFDEVQKLKNASSLGAHAARNLKARFRLSLTGTPVENHFGEFHNILDLTLPGIWGERFWRKNQNQDSINIAKKIVRPFILRRTKKQVLTELPDKIETPVLLDLTEKERDIYHQSLFSIKNILSQDQTVQHFNVLQFILKLRQLCLWQEQHNGEILSTKINFLVETLKQLHEEGHKALIFSQFTSYLDLIQNQLHQQGWKTSRIDGSLSLKKRDQELENFKQDKTDFFLISLKAGGFGLNLTEANYIFLMDPWWNPAVENQAIDRAHRIGQTKNVIVYRPIIKDSIEEKVLILQEKKKQLFTDLMGGQEDNIYDGRLSKNDFIELLS